MIPKKFSIYEDVKFVVQSPTLEKRKSNFVIGLIIIKVNIRAFRKDNRQVPQKLFHTHYCLDDHSGNEDWGFVIFEKCETHAQLKERETFWQHRLKTFYPIGLNENYINTKKYYNIKYF